MIDIKKKKEENIHGELILVPFRIDFTIYNVRSVQFNPQWFLKNLLVYRKHNVYGTLFSEKLFSNLRYIHSYSQILLTHFNSSRQQQRGYDVQKEYSKRKNVTDWLNFYTLLCLQQCKQFDGSIFRFSNSW